MIVPKGSMWGTGLSVSRPARLAVSSPKASATAPWETSCRMTEGMSARIKRISWVLTCVAAHQHHHQGDPGDDPDGGLRARVPVVAAAGRAWPGGPSRCSLRRPGQCFAAQLMQ